MTSNNGHDPRCHTTPLTLKDVEPKKRTQVAPEFRLASRSGREVGSSEICPSLPILPRRSGTERPPTPRGEEATESPSTRITRNSRGERLHCGLATQVEIHRRLESKVNGVECHPPGVGRKNRTQRVRGNLVLPPARAIPALQNRTQGSGGNLPLPTPPSELPPPNSPPPDSPLPGRRSGEAGEGARRLLKGEGLLHWGGGGTGRPSRAMRRGAGE